MPNDINILFGAENAAEERRHIKRRFADSFKLTCSLVSVCNFLARVYIIRCIIAVKNV